MSGLSDSVLEALSNPEEIVKGSEGELIAIKSLITNTSLLSIEKLIMKMVLLLLHF